ncbi:hypothetical protein B0H66DRAFT_528533 [Apodospora peruviana]|uniref:Uncharacterized protein n=1 Tax=Apodospora peruviana TaxID=516989 RepID=A0AAE0MG22_9PEZI|nr:hypothetical protein B0H66DRAFT_528533 [Apodospora peruviana]
MAIITGSIATTNHDPRLFSLLLRRGVLCNTVAGSSPHEKVDLPGMERIPLKEEEDPPSNKGGSGKIRPWLCSTVCCTSGNSVPDECPGRGFPGRGFPGRGFPGRGFPGRGFPGRGFPGRGFPGRGFDSHPKHH